MPLYEFRKENGDIVEMTMTMSDFDARVTDDQITLTDGSTATYYFNGTVGSSTCPSNYPMVSTAAGVHPDQIQQQVDYLRKKGCGFVEHTSDGDPVFTDKHQRKRVCEALGLFDRNGGFSDPQPQYRTANVRKYR